MPLRILDATVGPGAAIIGETVGALHRRRELSVLALDGRGRPREGLVIDAGAAISVVGTREACEDLVSQRVRDGRRRAAAPDVARPPVALGPVRRYRGAVLGED